MAQTAYEQYLIELVNRARLDPAGEAALYGVDLGTISPASKQPLAANDLLLAAAEGHSQWMLDTDTFSHTGANGSDPGGRMAAAGYVFTGQWAWGENIAWQGTTGTLNLVSAIDAAYAALFRSDGHRANILDDTFQEVGMGLETGQFASNGKTYNAAMVTQDFAKSGSSAFLTGVAYTDTDGNDFYSVGEGRGGVQIAAQLVGGATTTVTTDAPGGYDSKLGPGTYTVTMSGGGLSAALGMTITMANRNIKLDLLGTTAVACSASLIMGANLVGLTLLGTEDLSGTGNALANVIEGNKGANLIDGGAGADTLTGGAGNDTFVLKAGQANGDVIGDFTGNGSAAGDSIKFDGFSSAATLSNTSGNHWQIVDGSTIESFTINGAVNAADYSFVNVGAPPPPPPPPDPTGNETLVGTDTSETLSGG
ncbi:MAG TPA: CAP domain-containing protein, partial [Candidatus Acidoferrum sp.]|nr:CAP domain-containing protein [Candidatus Acidoferrum sp.]